MPRVGTKSFPYTPEGQQQAQAYSEATGLPVIDEQDMMTNAASPLENDVNTMNDMESPMPSYDARTRVGNTPGYGDEEL